MDAQEAIEISEKELKAYKEGLWRYKGEKEYEQHVAVGEALWILLESAKLLHEGMIEKVIDDGIPYLKLRNGSLERVTHSDLTDIGLEEGEVK